MKPQHWVIVAAFLLAACGSIAKPISEIEVSNMLPSPVTATPVVSGDPVKGAELFSTFQPVAGIACSTCHRVDSEERLVGPGLLHISTRAGQRIAGESAPDYVRMSILEPSTYVVEDYPDVMPKNWGKVFSEDELNDLIAYMMTL